MNREPRSEAHDKLASFYLLGPTIRHAPAHSHSSLYRKLCHVRKLDDAVRIYTRRMSLKKPTTNDLCDQLCISLLSGERIRGEVRNTKYRSSCPAKQPEGVLIRPTLISSFAGKVNFLRVSTSHFESCLFTVF